LYNSGFRLLLQAGQQPKEKIMMKMVLVLLTKNDQLYLGQKKLKIGKNQLNAPGGKFEKDDGGNPKRAAIREVRQESGVTIREEDLVQVALLHIYRQGHGHEIELHVLKTSCWSGDLKETEELGLLKPYPLDDIPYGDMMSADEKWLPFVLFGLSIETTFVYDKERKNISSLVITPKKFS
jgi:8-oxo-dGTP pyrophosphatase MutT (NUDIX family)